MSEESNIPFDEKLRRTIRDGIDYFQSVIELLQVKAVDLTLSTILSAGLFIFAGILALASFLMFNIALGVWLSYALESTGWAIIALGFLYGGLACGAALLAIRWFFKLKS